MLRDVLDHGYQYKPTDHADFMVADDVGLKEGYDGRVMDYGYPGFRVRLKPHVRLTSLR